MERTISRWQLLTLMFVAALSPFLRLIPGRIAQLSGSAGWLCGLAAYPCLLLLVWMLLSVLNRVCPDRGLAAGILEVFGKPVGGAVLLVWSAWLILHGGFLMRSGADRFIATIFPNSTPWMFVGVMAVLTLIAAMGHVKVLARSAEIFRPLLLIVILFVIGTALPNVEPSYLLPVRPDDAIPVGKSGLMVTESLCNVLLIGAFLWGYRDNGPLKLGRYARWLGWMCLLATVVTAVTVGVFGPNNTARMSYPFFAMIWDVNLFNTIQRMEAFVVGLWVLPDFVLVTMEVMVAADNLMLLFHMDRQAGKLLYWKDGGRVIWLCTALTVLAAVLIAGDTQALDRWSDQIIPMAGLAMCFVTTVALYLIAKLRKKL